MIIEKIKTEKLLPADYNPRKDLKPGDAEYEKLKRSIEQFGYVEPVIWNKTTGRVVGGHQRLTGILNTTGGGDVGVTSASATAITADELIDLYHSLKEPYRKDAVWILNDSTVKAIRKLKDGTGQYLWQPGIKDGEENTILGRPYYTSAFVPSIAAGAKTVIFGNLNYYWIGDREGITFKRLNELYAGNGQVGFLAYKRLDGKTVLPEAIKVLKMKSA